MNDTPWVVVSTVPRHKVALLWCQGTRADCATFALWTARAEARGSLKASDERVWEVEDIDRMTPGDRYQALCYYPDWHLVASLGEAYIRFPVVRNAYSSLHDSITRYRKGLVPSPPLEYARDLLNIGVRGVCKP